MTSFFLETELHEIGFFEVGTNVKISRKASIYGAENISIGNNVRIDDFCILSGKITIRNNIHVAAYSALFGGNVGIVLEDFVNLSSRISIYAISDDYSGESMTNPTIPDKFKNITMGEVTIKRHALIGASSIILPGVVVGEGCATGALTFVNRSLDPWGIYTGIPAKRIKDRSKNILILEKQFLDEQRL